MPAIPVFDLSLRVDTPEGCSLPLTPAGPLQRSLAWLADLGVRLLLILLGLQLSSLLGDIGNGLRLLLLFLLNWWYMVLFEVLWQGLTPGKRWLGLRVVRLDGSPPDWGCSLLRNLLRTLDMLPLGYSLGVLSCLSNPRLQRLGDLAAGTLVVHEPRPPRRSYAAPAGSPRSTPRQLDAAGQQAVLAFAERQASLPPARRQELAALLAAPLGLDAADPAGDLCRLAAGLRGQA